MNDLSEVVITAPDEGWLVEFCRRLVVEQLAASAHVFTPIRAIYTWQGEPRDHPEFRVALHTRSSLVPEIVKRLKSEHPYEVPGIVAVPITASSDEYAAWVREQTVQ